MPLKKKTTKEILESQISELRSQITALEESQDLSPIILQTLSESSSVPSISPNLKIRRTLRGHYGKIYAISWSSDSKHLVSASQDGKLIIWNAITQNKVNALTLRSDWVMACSFSPSSEIIACGGLDNIVSIIPNSPFYASSPIYGSPLINAPNYRGYKPPNTSGEDTEYDGSTFKRFIGNKDISRVAEVNPLCELSQHEGYISCISFVDEIKVLSGSGDSNLILWDIEKKKSEHVFEDHQGDVMSISVYLKPHSSPSAALYGDLKPEELESSEEEDSSKRDLKNNNTKEEIKRNELEKAEDQPEKFLKGGNGGISRLSDKIFITGSCDTTAKIFDLREKNGCQCTYEGHRADVNDTAFMGDTYTFITGSDDGTVRLWDLRSHSMINVYSQDEKNSSVVSVAGSNTGRFIIGSSDDKFCVVWDTLTGERVQTLTGHEKRVSSLEVSPDGGALCTASWDRTLKIWC